MSQVRTMKVLDRDVHFYVDRKAAIAHANTMTKTLQEQHTAIHHKLGWLMANVVQKTMLDAVGPLPMDVLQELKKLDA